MKPTLRVLHLEDSEDDAELVTRELRKATMDIEIMQVEGQDTFREALEQFKPDVILSDHSLPSFNSHEALRIVRANGIFVPFILVTATVSEEYAVSVLQEGADDYVLKDRLQRLPAAIANALEKYEMEDERRKAINALRSSEQKYKLLFDHNPLPMWMISATTSSIIGVNEAAIHHYGYSREEFLSMNSRDLRPPEDEGPFVKQARQSYGKSTDLGIWRHLKKDGSMIYVNVIEHDVELEGEKVRLLLGHDMTEKLEYEQELARQRGRQQRLITETVIRAQEKEREEIGRELHDNVNQLLATAVLLMDFAIKKDNIISDTLADSMKSVRMAIDEIRRLSHNLVGPALDGGSLRKAMEELVGKVSNAGEVQFSLVANRYTGEEPDKDIKLMLYRIAQEQISNILKHAQATRASVELSSDNKRVLLIITDNGRGFNPDLQAAGIGLRNITNRVHFYKGTLSIQSAPGEGCRVEISVPVRRPSAEL